VQDGIQPESRKQTSEDRQQLQSEACQELAIRALEILNQPSRRDTAIDEILSLIKEASGMEAVAIRLVDGHDFPYRVSTGFSDAFVTTESALCNLDEEGNPKLDEQGRNELECLCGSVIRGEVDRSSPCYTESGSFWTGRLGELLRASGDNHPCSRRRCHYDGYESVTLVPLRCEQEIVGLLQLNDRRPNMLSPQMLALIERLGASIGIWLDRVHTEERLAASLKEKEILLREIHHRVKNNMQVVMSLLKLQARQVRDPEAREAFIDSQNRIRAMALIHETLHQSRDFAQIPWRDYVEALVTNLSRAHRGGPATVAAEVGEVRLNIDHAVPVGLIINELVTNAMEHAFTDGRRGEIKVSIVPVGESQLQLTVSDNGIGLPDDFDAQQSESLGLRLVSALAERQLNGSLEVSRNHGTTFMIKFQSSTEKLQDLTPLSR
jgi:two-component sensor histidine kinase